MAQKSKSREVWKRLKKNKAAMVGLTIIVVFCFFAIFADVIADYDKKAISHTELRLEPPSAEHWFGTDAYGRDVFARIVHGARISLSIGVSATFISLVIGSLLGAAAGFYGGKVDAFIMMIMDTLLCIPAIMLALAIVAALESSIINLIIACTVSQAPSFARVIRSVVMIVVGNDYIEAAKASGMRDFRIIYKYIIPNVMGPIMVQGTMAVGSMIITAAALSFIGMGVPAPTPEWGAMLSDAGDYIRRAPHLVIFPGLAIAISTLSLNLLGDGLRDAMDPRLKG